MQFQLVKASQLDDTRAEELEWLSDACKICVVMQHEGSTITQTLNVESYDATTAEWGLWSEKLRLLAGDYNIIGYYIYDNLDNEIMVGERQGEFTVEHDGLTIKTIGVETVERGMVSFALLKAYEVEFIDAIDGKRPGIVIDPRIELWTTETFERGEASAELYYKGEKLKISEDDYYLGENKDEKMALYLWYPKAETFTENVYIIFKARDMAAKLLVVKPVTK